MKLWWPNGYGDQNLYTFFIRASVNNEVSSFSSRFGFRTVKLVQKPINPVTPNQGLIFFLSILYNLQYY